MNYVVIDFETANERRDSVCALGMLEVNNGKIIKKYDYLINPEDYFNPFNTSINGITEEMVEGKPTFLDLWSEIKLILENTEMVIAHNASFDISVLRHTLEKYELEFPTFKYSCTRILSKRTWPSLINYRLDTVADSLNINFTHHQAIEDSRACSEILEKIIEVNGCTDFEELHNKLKVKIGSVFPGGYKPAEVKSSTHSLKAKDIIAETNIFDENHEFYNKGITFTGTLSSMTRHEAAQLVVNKGAIFLISVTKATNYLVMGIQDYSRFVDGKKSNKLKKAELLISKGQDLEIIDENEFLRLL